MKQVRLEQQFLERKGNIVFREKNECSNKGNGLIDRVTTLLPFPVLRLSTTWGQTEQQQGREDKKHQQIP